MSRELGSLVSLASIPFLSNYKSNIDTNINSGIENQRLIHITNKLGYDIALYYEDHEGEGSGTFMTIIKSDETLDMQSTPGDTFFATEGEDATNRIAMLYIRNDENEYSIEDPGSSTVIRNNKEVTMKLNHDFKNRPHPAIKKLNGPISTAMSVKFRNLSAKKIDLWYFNGVDGTEQGHLAPGRETTTNSYEGHVFYATEHGGSREICRFSMSKDKTLYLIEDPIHPAPQHMLEFSNQELAFHEEYYKQTGIHWRHYYGPDGPRPPPSLFMWPAEKIGQVHKVNSPEGYWECDGTEGQCQSDKYVELELELVSTEPRVFIIPNFLSEFEVGEIIKLARPHIKQSHVGDVEVGVLNSDTRTSKNAWVPRTSSAITESLFLRAADLLNIDEKLLTRTRNAEDMQVVHYDPGQKYDAHHDWGVGSDANSRFLTLLLYLTDQPNTNAGGETSFPKGLDGRGFKVHPGKGSAVLFYNLLEDGNGDDLALHAALPVKEGEKWLANFWVWVEKFH